MKDRARPHLPSDDSLGLESPVAATAPARDRSPAWVLAWPVALFAILSALLVFLIGDLRFDLAHDVPAGHVELQLLVVALGFLGLGGTTVHLGLALRRARKLMGELQGARVEVERWRSEKEALLRRIGISVEHHFVRWGLTSAEKEIALLVLRGLSYKEVASARGTAERTVRHQALGIYRKAGVAGRAEMAAAFLHDVLAAAGTDAPALAADGPPPASS